MKLQKTRLELQLKQLAQKIGIYEDYKSGNNERIELSRQVVDGEIAKIKLDLIRNGLAL
jgi:hypothetical protein